MGLDDVPENLSSKHFYAKVVEYTGNNRTGHIVRFTSTPPEIVSYFLAHQQHGNELADAVKKALD